MLFLTEESQKSYWIGWFENPKQIRSEFSQCLSLTLLGLPFLLQSDTAWKYVFNKAWTRESQKNLFAL